MLNKSRYQSADSQRQYDIPGASHGASLRGPYKRWIPQADNRLSESETDAPKSSSHRPRGYNGSSSHVAVADRPCATASTSHSRHQAGSSSQTHAPASHPHRSERSVYGYSSESTVHAPPPPAKSSSSAFNLFKVKDSKINPGSTTWREEPPHSTTAPVPIPSRYSTQTPPIPPARPSRDGPVGASGGVFGSLSTRTSTDTSPRSSTDSGPRNGHASAPAAQTSELRKHGHTIWNPYSDAKLSGDSTTRQHEVVAGSNKRDDKQEKDREDMVARVTEALGGDQLGRPRLLSTRY
ncbi:hypothetical protein JB92DRAFT_542895 [Gautieria morchelliformis]|nr:hypothetical protein JB92DRAFT_542895 [Gautieria morchelliformis]